MPTKSVKITEISTSIREEEPRVASAAPLSPDSLPAELTDRITYSADRDEYRLFCGSDDLAEVVITNTRDLGGTLAVSGKLIFLAENTELACFSATLAEADNLFGYTLIGLDVI